MRPGGVPNGLTLRNTLAGMGIGTGMNVTAQDCHSANRANRQSLARNLSIYGQCAYPLDLGISRPEGAIGISPSPAACLQASAASAPTISLSSHGQSPY